MAPRDYTVGAADTDTGAAAVPTAPLAGEKVKIPVYTDPADGPLAFVDFVNSLPRGGSCTVAETAPTAPAPKSGDMWFKPSTKAFSVYTGTAWVGLAAGPKHTISTHAPTAADAGNDGDLWFVHT